MKVSGLTILKNAALLDYPFIESIRSVLPLCDEFVAIIGEGDDDTAGRVLAMNDPRIRVVMTKWSDKVTPARCVLSQQTNIGLHMCTGDWVVYLQANEVLHENSHKTLKALMVAHLENTAVEAMLLERICFWGDYNHYLSVYPHRYKYSPRILRPYIGTYSIRDAMSFAIFDNFSLRGRYPRAIDTGQDIFRYGYACGPESLEEKDANAVHMKTNKRKFDEDYFYTAMPKAHVLGYNGSHPAVMNDRIDGYRAAIGMDDDRWRISMSFKEWQRVLETRLYKNIGIPRLRNTRYVLKGNYAKKDRDS